MLVIEEDGFEDVYDFSVPHTSNFFINDVLVHNCAEIFLRSCGFCNLTEAIARAGDTLQQLKDKIEVATILGTFQSTLTNFKFLRPVWKKNAEEERLLGVSLTGIMDHEVLSGYLGKEMLESWLDELREHAIEVNRVWAEKLGINQSVAVTCVKPSGCTTPDTTILTYNKDGHGRPMTMNQIFRAAGYSLNDYASSEDVWLDTNELELKVLDENGDLQDITKLYVNGMCPVMEIEFEDGSKYKFTPNHKLMTTNGWKRVDELTVDDELVKQSFKGPAFPS